jgi:hypothetical protein
VDRRALLENRTKAGSQIRLVRNDVVMPQKFKAGDKVMVNAAKLVDPDRYQYALIEKTVERVEKSSVIILDHQQNEVGIWADRVHAESNFGVSILRIGDVGSDPGLLDPLAKSILHFTKLLLPEERVRFFSARTKLELRRYLEKHFTLFSYVIIVGHGEKDRLLFLDGDAKAPESIDILGIRTTPDMPPKTVISLACKTGARAFAGKFSEASWCRNFIGPYQSVYGAAASQFCQSFLAWHFLDKLGIEAAHRAAKAVPRGPSFRLYRDGSILASRHST